MTVSGFCLGNYGIVVCYGHAGFIVSTVLHQMFILACVLELAVLT